jgi:hypothetical protein
MNFVRSRLALVSVVLAWPCAQLAGCSQTEREYGPLGEGGDMPGGSDGSGGSKTGGTAGKSTSGGKGGASGGASGKGTGATAGSTGASDAGGMAGDMGSGGSSQGGENGATGGSGGKGGTGGKGGAGGSAGKAGNGGSAGAGMCVPTGDEVCGDGIDNDCNGKTDCLVLTDEFPAKNGAASGADVQYVFEAPATGAEFECRVSHGDMASGTFGDCAGGATSSGRVSPFSSTDSADPGKDGLWTTQVRLRFPDGSVSELYSRPVYIHSSLNGVTRCPANVSAEAYVAAAQPHLADEGAFTVTTVRNPFVEIDFDPPVDGRYTVAADDGTVHWPSLRRQFTFDPDHHYLVMTRTYTARNADYGMGCNAAVKRVHLKRGQLFTPGTGPYMEFQVCNAIVFNKKGAGYCLSDTGGVATTSEHIRGDGGVQVPAPTYSPEADNLAWRKLTARLPGGLSTNFSPKCDTDGCASGYTLFLPDSSYFPYWTD